MAWDTKAFENINGEKPLEKFIKSLESSTIAKVAHAIDLLQKHGNTLGMPRSKKLEGNLYELRVRGKQEIRIFYIFKGKQIYLLHGFKKQTQKTPRKEIEIALERTKIIDAMVDKT